MSEKTTRRISPCQADGEWAGDILDVFQTRKRGRSLERGFWEFQLEGSISEVPMCERGWTSTFREVVDGKFGVEMRLTVCVEQLSAKWARDSPTNRSPLLPAQWPQISMGC